MSRRLLVWVVGLALAARVAGAAAEPATVRLVEVTSASTAASQSVLITATEPASYTTRQPDPLTVLITLRDVAAGDVATTLRPAPDDPVTSVEVLDAVDADGNPVVQVRIGLREPTVYEVRSRRQTIQVRFARSAAAAPIRAAADAGAAPARHRPATALLSVATAVEPHAVTVTLHGNGALSPGRIHEIERLPPRLVIEFPDLVTEAAAVTSVEIDPVKQVRVASEGPELTRVVLDLARPAVYHVEPVDNDDRVLRVVFPRDRAIDPVARTDPDPASRTAAAWTAEAAIPELVTVAPFDITAVAFPARLTGPVALGGDGSPLLHPVLGDVPARVWPEIRQLPGAMVAMAPNAAPLLRPVPGDVPARVWPEIRQLPGAMVAMAPNAAPLLRPVPGDVPARVWPEIRQLPGAMVAMAPNAAPLLRPVPGDVPARVWPEIRQLPGAMVAMAPNVAPLLRPVPGDVPAGVWPEIRQLPGAMVAMAPNVAPLLRPVPGDVPAGVWPEIRQLPGAMVAMAPNAAPLLRPVPGDVPAGVWPEIPQSPVAVLAAAPDAALLLSPEPGDLASPPENADTGIAPAVVEPVAVDVPAPGVEPAAVVTPVVSTGRFLSLRRSGGTTGAPAPRAAVQLSGQPLTGEQEYTGEPISMDFQNIDLRAVLRVFAEISGLNLVIDPSVVGEVNVVLTQVPWDQAFAIILRANGLDYEVDGTVVRIASVDRLREEALARAALAQSEADAGELVIFTRALSYARAEDLVQLLTNTTLSSRGEVFVDGRTNTLIIRDLQDRLLLASDLLDTLDQAEPQVEIEARIVQAGHDSARALGVQWGLTGRVAQEIGNTLPFSFPNRGGISGRAGSSDGQGPFGSDPRALADENAGTVVNLGVGGATSAIGLTMGAVNGALNLDVILSALESEGELSIISSPRVMTQNNVEAVILQGDQIPYQTVANNTVTVQFKEAALQLRVLPQITAANTVIMEIVLENSFPDFARALGNPPIPPIVTQRATTTVQVRDGETTVIGGIYENTQTRRNNRVPILHRIPLLGWLFKSNDRSESTDELMIFITPRIVR